MEQSLDSTNQQELTAIKSAVYHSESQRKVHERTFEFIAQRGWLSTGENFYDALMKFLNKELNIAYALVSTVSEDKKIAETLVVSAFGESSQNFSYKLLGTPCENVIAQKLCAYTENIQALFPDDQLLNDLGAVSYFGIPLWNSKAEVLGLIAVLDTKPRNDSEFITSILQISAARLSSEIERDKIENALRKSERRFNILFDDAPDAMFLADPETGIIMDTNKAACRLFKKEKNELIGIHHRNLHPADVAKKTSADFERHLLITSSETNIDVIENHIVTSNGEWRMDTGRNYSSNSNNRK